MDWLTFISKIAWPIVVGIALIYFRKPLKEHLSSLKKIQVGDTIFECEDSRKPTNDDAVTLEKILKTCGAHSFDWLRSTGKLLLSDNQFNTLISNNNNKFQKIIIQLINQNGNIIANRDGVKLTNP